MKKKFKALVRRFLWQFGYVLTPVVIENDPLVKEEFADIYAQIKEYTGVGLARSYGLYKAVEYIVKNNIEGDFVECGVANGGCVMNIALTLKKLGVTDRKIYLYDTFEGMTMPSEHDFVYGKTPEKLMKKWENRTVDGTTNWQRYTLEAVKANLKQTGYPEENLIYVEGKVEDTIPKIMPEKISLLRLDTDFYESTKHEMEHLYPIMSSGGALLLDDYGSWMGEKKAVDEFFGANPILLNRIDRDGRVGVKP